MRTMHFFLLIFLLVPALIQGQKPQDYKVTSPDGNIRLQVKAGDTLLWSVSHGKDPVIVPSSISLQLASGEQWGRKMKIISAKNSRVHEIIAPLHYKKESIVNEYNQLLIRTRNGYDVEFRVYNEGVAYRFVGHASGKIVVKNEEASFRFAGNYSGFFPYANDPHIKDAFQISFENTYQHIPISEFKDTLAFAPVMIELPGGKKAVITEADLEDYPGMFLEHSKDGTGLSGRFAPYPLEEKQGGHNNLQSFVVKRADYLAETPGTRTFPWRVVVVSAADKDLLDNDIVYKLASPNRLTETGWIKPGKVAWDWWNDWNISHVDFRAGINTETYKYYIDFASAHGIEYILLDEGWANSTDIMKIVPAIHLQEIIDYGKQKNVGIWLWGGWLPLDKKMDEAFGTYSRMGIKGFKVDFMDRDDQKMVQFYYRLAQKAAEYHLMIDFHGAYKPTGLQRTYPNVVNFEGVHGMEQVKWSNRDFPLYDVTIPYIRMLAGPMDYTPGAMRNASKQNFRPINAAPMSQGTRCHQLAMYIIFESPFEMLADNPTIYMRESECLAFITSVPTVFDETRALDGKTAEYAAIARRKGNEWFAGVMTNWTARDLELDLSFLGPGNFEAEIFRDGINADREATDYKKEIIQVPANRKWTIHLAPGGGWAARIYPAR